MAWLLTITTENGNTVDVDIDLAEINFDNGDETSELLAALREAASMATAEDAEALIEEETPQPYKPGDYLKGCNGDPDKIRQRCRDMDLKELEELQTRLENALANPMLAANHEGFRKALTIATEVLGARHARMDEAAKRNEPGVW